MADSNTPEINFTDLIQNYKNAQNKLMQKVRSLGSKLSTVNPGQFILLQFEFAQVAQVGESVSNMITQVNTMIKNAISNQTR